MDYSDRTLNKLIVISLILHGLFLMGLPRIKVAHVRKTAANLEITYQKLRIEQAVNKKLLETVERRSGVNKDAPKQPSQAKQPSSPPAYVEGTNSQGKKSDFSRIRTPSIREKSLAGIVRLPEAASPFMKNPAYMSYYEIIREKIKGVASLNSPLTAEGEVYLTFVLDSSGQLKALKLIDDKSVPDQALRQLAYNYVEQASPFPPFPKDLKHAQLSFNVIIEFRLGD